MVTWEEVFAELAENPEFKREYDALEGWYQEELARQESCASEDPASSPRVNTPSILHNPAFA